MEITDIQVHGAKLSGSEIGHMLSCHDNGESLHICGII
jgi:hypothetical protein